jgi:hypothetical protein
VLEGTENDSPVGGVTDLNGEVLEESDKAISRSEDIIELNLSNTRDGALGSIQ